MVPRQRRTSGRHFGVPTPLNPITGERATQALKTPIPELSIMRVTLIGDNYIRCDGWDQIRTTWTPGLLVAKPPLLRLDPEADIRYPTATATVANISAGSRDVLLEANTGGDDIQQREFIDPPYFLGELLLAFKVEGYLGQSAPVPIVSSGNWATSSEIGGDVPVDTMSVGGVTVLWQDMNVGAKRWRAADLIRFEMVAALTVGGSAEVLATVWDGALWSGVGPTVTFTVHDFQERFSKMATISGDVGALGYAQYRPDKDAFEIVSMQTPADFWGTLDGPLETTEASGAVTVYSPGAVNAVFRGYDYFGINQRGTITCFNPVANQNSYWWAGAANDYCFCKWDVEHSKYWIQQMEPMAGKHAETVVVASGAPDTTKTITLPKWITFA